VLKTAAEGRAGPGRASRRVPVPLWNQENRGTPPRRGAAEPSGSPGQGSRVVWALGSWVRVVLAARSPTSRVAAGPLAGPAHFMNDYNLT